MNDVYIPQYGKKKKDPKKVVSTEIIFHVVEEYFGIDRATLLTKTKKIVIAYPRQVCIWLLAKYSCHGSRGISVMFNFKDAGSTLAAIRAIDDYLATDDHVRIQIGELEYKLKTI